MSNFSGGHLSLISLKVHDILLCFNEEDFIQITHFILWRLAPTVDRLSQAFLTDVRDDGVVLVGIRFPYKTSTPLQYTYMCAYF